MKKPSPRLPRRGPSWLGRILISEISVSRGCPALDLRGIADLLRDGERLGMAVAACGREDIVCQVPMVVLEHMVRHRRFSLCPIRGSILNHQNSNRSANCISRGVPDPTGVTGDTAVFTVSMMLPNPVGQPVGDEEDTSQVASGCPSCG
jgi:hypothetical protein